MCAEDIEIFGQVLEKESLSKLLNGENIDEESIPTEPLKRQSFEDILGGEDRSAEEYDVRMAFAEIVKIREERDAEAAGVGGVIGSGMGKENMALGS